MISRCSADLSDARQDLCRAIRRPAGHHFKTPMGRVASALCRASNEWTCPKMCPKARPKFPTYWRNNIYNRGLYEVLTILRKLKWRIDRDSNRRSEALSVQNLALRSKYRWLQAPAIKLPKRNKSLSDGIKIPQALLPFTSTPHQHHNKKTAFACFGLNSASLARIRGWATLLLTINTLANGPCSSYPDS